MYDEDIDLGGYRRTEGSSFLAALDLLGSNPDVRAAPSAMQRLNNLRDHYNSSAITSGQIEVGTHAYSVSPNAASSIAAEGASAKSQLPNLQAEVSVYPNPATYVVTIKTPAAFGEAITLSVYSLTGRRVYTHHATGSGTTQHSIRWQLVDDGGARVPAGTYLVVLSTDSFQRTTRVTVL